MKKQISILLVLTSALQFSWRGSDNSNYQSRIKQRSKEAYAFCVANNFNTEICILIDLSIHSGKRRAFFLNLKNDSILSSSLCAHGCGENPWGGTSTKEKPSFSNVPDSHCSSIGKFKIGKRGYSNWGIKINYLLYGLESTNNNALKREIVLHSWEDVAEKEVYPEGTPEGWGCPAVANSFMKTIDLKLKGSEKPVLLWIFN
ncbi:MAG: murein L,D-transpeptidase catalytic domain family protein [Bacteroidetes bacterium]|nr:murein L,D-transpeptidase catalytic domain family protein [Bacteroidota bacterium]